MAPILRLSVPRTIWAKLSTQCQKKENADLLAGIKALKITTGNANASVLWDPPQAVLIKMRDVLKREEGFTRDRQKGGCSHQLMLSTIADIESKITKIE